MTYHRPFIQFGFMLADTVELKILKMHSGKIIMALPPRASICIGSGDRAIWRAGTSLPPIGPLGHPSI